MSCQPNDVPQWPVSGPAEGHPEDRFEDEDNTTMGYNLPGTVRYVQNMSQFPVSMEAVATPGLDISPSSGFLDPMYTYDPSDAAGVGNPYYPFQYNAPPPYPGQLGCYTEYDTGDQEINPAGEGGSNKQAKKRPPRQYTSEQLSKRREQNRKSQRAYRDRKDQRIKELENELAAASQQNDMISSAIDALRAEYKSLTGIHPGPLAESTSFDGATPTTMV